MGFRMAFWPIRTGSRLSSSRTLWRTTKVWGRIGEHGGPFGHEKSRLLIAHPRLPFRVGVHIRAVVVESTLRTNLLSLTTTRTRHVGNDPNVERYDPDLWTDEFTFLNQPGHGLPSSSRMFEPPVRPAFRLLSPCRARLPGFRTQRNDCIEDMDFGFRHVAAIGLRFRKLERQIVFEIAALVRGFLGSPR